MALLIFPLSHDILCRQLQFSLFKHCPDSQGCLIPSFFGPLLFCFFSLNSSCISSYNHFTHSFGRQACFAINQTRSSFTYRASKP